MTGGQHAGRDAPLDERGKAEQSERVGDLGPRSGDPRRQLVMRAPEVLEQLLVGRRLLEGVELAAVEVLQQRVPEQVRVVRLPDDRRHDVQAGTLRRPPAPFAHDELVTRGAVTRGTYDDRLEHADLPDRARQFLEGVLVELRARLPRIRPDRLDRYLGEMGPGDWHEFDCFT